MANKHIGWGAVGYGLAGGFYRDRKSLQNQAAESSKDVAQGSKYNQEAEQQKLINESIIRDNTMLKNQMAAKDLEQATDSLVENGDYEGFNKAISSNPTLQTKMFNNYKVKSIHPINWSSKIDIMELVKAGIPKSSIENLDDEAKQDLSKAFYMTDAGHLTSLSEFLDHTGYLSRATSDKFEYYLNIKKKLANIGKKTTTDEVKAMDMTKWLQANPDKTVNDYNALGKKDAPLTTSQVKAQDFLEYKKIPGNEHKTMTDYENEGKPKAEKSMTTAGLKNEYADLEVKASKGTLTEDESIRRKVLDKLFSTDSDEKRQILVQGMEITDKYRGKLFSDDLDISNEDVTNAKLYAQQAGIKPDTKANRELKDQFNTVKTGRRLVDEVMALKDEELSRGLVDTGIQKLKKLLSDKSFSEMSPEKQAKALKSINMNTKLGMFLAKYIKSISGTAVAQSEYDRLTNLFSGSNFDNTQSLKEGVKTFVDELDRQFRDTAQTSLLDNPSTTLDLVKRYKELPGYTSDTKEVSKAEPVVTQKEPTITQKDAQSGDDTYEGKYKKFSSLIGQVNPKNGKKLVGFEEEAPFNPIYEEVK